MHPNQNSNKALHVEFSKCIVKFNDSTQEEKQGEGIILPGSMTFIKP